MDFSSILAMRHTFLCILWINFGYSMDFSSTVGVSEWVILFFMNSMNRSYIFYGFLIKIHSYHLLATCLYVNYLSYCSNDFWWRYARITTSHALSRPSAVLRYFFSTLNLWYSMDFSSKYNWKHTFRILYVRKMMMPSLHNSSSFCICGLI